MQQYEDKQFNQKMYKRHEKTFYQRRESDKNKQMKTLNISHQGNAD